MKLSLILPAYNEERVLGGVLQEIRENVKNLPADEVEYLLVNDGSTDGTLGVMKSFKQEVRAGIEVRIINFARNFGHQAAVTAGIAEATGDALILMDTDGQDDPSVFRSFIDKWTDGNEVVFAVRTRREEAGWMRLLFTIYYRMFAKMSRIAMPLDAGNFGLLDRRVAEQIRALPEHHRYFPGLRAWVGFKQCGVDCPRRARADGNPKVGLMGLFKLALDAVVSFSDFPLRLAFFLALVLITLSFAGISIIVGIKLLGGDAAVPMWASVMTTVIFIGAVQFFMIGLLGEYVGRIYSEVKRRPHYVIREIL